MELIQITKEEFDVYAKNCPYKNFYQTSEYGMLMDRHSFDDYYLALKDEMGNIKAATLILITKVFIGYKWGYCPRGYLIDFKDTELLKEFTEQLKIYLKKRNFMFVKIDPYVINKSRDKLGNEVAGIDNSSVIDSLISLGYEHTGFNLNFENMKPRWNAVIETNSYENLFQKYSKEIRNKIRKAEKMGLQIVKGDPDNIKEFYSIIDNKHTRKLNYYLDMYEILGKSDMFEIYFAVINTPRYIEKSKEMYEQEEKRNNEINYELEENTNNAYTQHIIRKKMESDALLNNYKQHIVTATNLFKTAPQGVVIGVNAIIKYNNEIFFLIDGYKNEYKQYCPNHFLKFQIIEKYRKQDYTRIHLNGITGDLKNTSNPYYGLSRFKLGFNANVEEYIGEFTLVVNKGKYSRFKKLNPIMEWLKQPVFKQK
jgi:lipid II:glycine glycyltransferase (peptidoglycan interpeptide bridge formation enzyme)